MKEDDQPKNQAKDELAHGVLAYETPVGIVYVLIISVPVNKFETRVSLALIFSLTDNFLARGYDIVDDTVPHVTLEEMNSIANLLTLTISSTLVCHASGFASALSRSCKRIEERGCRGLTSEHRSCFTGDYHLVKPSRGAPDNRSIGSQTPWGHRLSRPLSQWLPPLLAISSVTWDSGNDFTQEPERPPGGALGPHDPRIQTFEDWTKQERFRGGVEHADFEGLRGLMARDGIDPWKPIVTVPASLLLLQEYSMVTRRYTSFPPPEPLSTDVWQRCPWWVRLGVRLLKEKCAGEDSKLREYIGILPKEGGNGIPLNWSTEQLKCLHYPRLLSQVSLQRRLIKRENKRVEAERAPVYFPRSPWDPLSSSGC